MTLTTRFAPSPTGHLHLGHAFSALNAYHYAKRASGRFILRIEDIDQARCLPEFTQAIYADLAWLGLDWESPVRVQSQHMADYHAALDRLREHHLIYRCFKTRKAIAADIGRAPHGLDLPYRGQPLSPDQEAEHMARGHAFAWRLSLAAARQHLGKGFDDLTFIEDGRGVQVARPQQAGDIVLARKDLGVAYHLAVVVDDALQGVTHVTRGDDLFEATGVQRLLQALLGLPIPTYCHHSLLSGPDGQRLAKRDRAQTLKALREGGMDPSDLRRQLGFD